MAYSSAFRLPSERTPCAFRVVQSRSSAMHLISIKILSGGFGWRTATLSAAVGRSVLAGHEAGADGAVVFLRKIARGGAHRSFGIEVAALAGVPKEVTVRAKAILKALEKSDIARGKIQMEFAEEEPSNEKQLSEVERILADTDINTLSPMQALMLLSDLKEKIDAEN